MGCNAIAATDANVVALVKVQRLAFDSQAAREYLATLNDAAFRAASPVTPKFVSLDPIVRAQGTGAHKGHAFFAYAPTI